MQDKRKIKGEFNTKFSSKHISHKKDFKKICNQSPNAFRKGSKPYKMK